MNQFLAKFPFACLVCFLLVIAFFTACSNQDPAQLSVLVPEDPGETPADAPASPTTLPFTKEPASPSPGTDQEIQATDPVLDGLFFTLGVGAGQINLITIDPASGAETVIFSPPENAWLTELALSPDGSQILLAYSPPPEVGQVQNGFTDMYLMPVDGSAEPELLLAGAGSSESYFNISWPVQDTIYYAHFAPSFADDGLIIYGSQVERLHLPDAAVESLAPGAAWPRVSDDGTLLAYVTDANELILAESSGANPKILLGPETFSAIDAPLFSPDNSLLCFSAVGPAAVSLPSFLSRLLGLKIAYAHNVPSDWYCIPPDSPGELLRLTELDGLGLYGDFSADGRYLAFMSTAGIYVVQPDGSGLHRLQERDLTGTLNWLP